MMHFADVLTISQCTTPSVKGPIATLKLAKGQIPTILTVYETLHDKYDPRGLSAFKGVSILLLDYLVVTGLLLVTDLQDWMLVRKFEDDDMSRPHSSDASGGQGSGTASDLPPTSDPQWRKIMFGEPLYPKLGSEGHSNTSKSPTTTGFPGTPTSPIEVGHPYSYFGSEEGSSSRPSSRSQKMRLSSVTTEDDVRSEDMAYEGAPISPSAESVAFTSPAPSHTYLEPSFYGSDPPPVPPLPLQYVQSFNGRNAKSQPTTPVSATFKPLPQHPPISTRSSHTPSEERPHSSLSQSSPVEFANPHRNNEAEDDDDDDLPPIDSFPPRHSVPQELSFGSSSSSIRSESVRSSISGSHASGSLSRPGSSARTRRPLPRPPPVPPLDGKTITPTNNMSMIPNHNLVPRRTQSSTHLEIKPFAKGGLHTPPRPQRSLPPTPHDSRPASSPLAGELEVMVDAGAEADFLTSQGRTDSDIPPSAGFLSPDQAHGRQPPITKSSQEDLTDWVHKLTSPQRDLPPAPLPQSTIFDVPPPAYSSINFSSRPQGVERPPVPTVNLSFAASASGNGGTG